MDPELASESMSLHPAGRGLRSPSHQVRNLGLGGTAAAGVLLGAAGVAGVVTTHDTASTDVPGLGAGGRAVVGLESEALTAAALEDLPDDAVILVGPDGSGTGPYEALIQTADGAVVTVRLDG